MKRCPACNRTYTDESLRFCLDDGVELLREGAPPYDPHQTLQIPAARGTDPASIDAKNPDATLKVSPGTQSKYPKTLIIVGAIALVAIVVLSVELSYLYFSHNKSGATSSTPEPAATTNTAPDATPKTEGRWFVIISTHPKTELSKAEERLDFVRKKGYEARLIDTDDYPNLKNGSWAVVIGPLRRDQAQEVADKVRSIAPDVYIKSGW